ncbi:MAG: alkaline serine protease [Bdellovibrio sp. CG10_big_fil_rev_8_21_14_0_10_47_8]|nr:MAG: alkaline serine protease [Bdellovibrio sp. CG10_big_fil_rev_8_21_14_0_10_47_8]
MDVRKLILPILFLSLSACDKKKDLSSVTDSANKQDSGACDSQSLVRTRFIISYEDGRYETVLAENLDQLKNDFVAPRLQEIKRVEYDVRLQINSIPTQGTVSESSAESSDWGSAIVQAPAVWNQGILGQGVKVAVVDAMVDYSHPQIQPRLSVNESELNGKAGVDDDGNGLIDDVYGWDFLNQVPEPKITNTENMHGTHVAGIILADHETGNVPGMAPKAELIPANFMDQDGSGSVADAIPAIKYAVSRGARIINASWGGGCSDTLREVIQQIGQGEKGVLFVAAAGNDSFDYDHLPTSYFSYPAVFNLSNQITVASSSADDLLSYFSNRSYSLVHIAAPGSNIRSTVPHISDSSGSGYLSGTSMAAPFVSGAAALLWSAKPKATVAQIRQALLASVDKKPVKVSTQGRLNVLRALDEIRRIAP